MVIEVLRGNRHLVREVVGGDGVVGQPDGVCEDLLSLADLLDCVRRLRGIVDDPGTKLSVRGQHSDCRREDRGREGNSHLFSPLLIFCAFSL